MTRRSRTATLMAAAALTAAAAAPAAQATAPTVSQMVVFRSGAAKVSVVRAAATSVKVGRKRCGVASGTPLAALARSRVAKLTLRDYASCGRKPRDSAGLYVRQIGPDRASGRGGWVYKVGAKQGTAGAGDPAGPFGRGRIRPGSRVLWFFCHLDRSGGCEHTLGLKLTTGPGGTVTATVKGYDDVGKAAPVSGATVHVGAATAVTGAGGVAHLTVAAGTYSAYAQAPGTIRSFPEKAMVG